MRWMVDFIIHFILKKTLYGKACLWRYNKEGKIRENKSGREIIVAQSLRYIIRLIEFKSLLSD